MTTARWADQLAARALRLPAPTTGYRVRRGVPVPMRDGVMLRADHYAPLTATPSGTVLVRGPYGRGQPFAFLYAQIYAARGYHVLLQSVRGTTGSGGVFVPMVHEADDAADTVVWLREQPWFTGSFGTLGLSYLGYTQWALLADPPPELAAAVIAVGPHDFHDSTWGTGSFALNDFLGWADMMAHQERPALRRLAFQIRAARRLAGAAAGVPLGEAGRALLGGQSPWYESWLEHPDPDDPFWAPMRRGRAVDRCDVPVLLVSGWQDVFVDQTLDQYRRLRSRGTEVALTVGPWTHDQMVTRATGRTAAETLAWLGRHLAGERAPARATPVRVFVTGRRAGWVDLPDWPPATEGRRLYLRPGAALADSPVGSPVGSPAGAPAETSSGSVSFVYRPADPTPAPGGRLLSRQAGYRDDTALAGRPDVCSFTGAALAADLTVCGEPVVELDHGCDSAHFDVFVRISEVDARGRSRNVSDGFRRFTATPDGPIRLVLDPVAHRFGAGSRIRVLIAGGCHPRFARNLGTGEPQVSGHRMVPSGHTVRFGPRSSVLLPTAGQGFGGAVAVTGDDVSAGDPPSGE